MYFKGLSMTSFLYAIGLLGYVVLMFVGDTEFKQLQGTIGFFGFAILGYLERSVNK